VSVSTNTGVDHGVLYIPNDVGRSTTPATPGTALVDGHRVAVRRGGQPAVRGQHQVPEPALGRDSSAAPSRRSRTRRVRSVRRHGIAGARHQSDRPADPQDVRRLSYRTKVGNDLNGPTFGYKIHLVYGASRRLRRRRRTRRSTTRPRRSPSAGRSRRSRSDASDGVVQAHGQPDHRLHPGRPDGTLARTSSRTSCTAPRARSLKLPTAGRRPRALHGVVTRSVPTAADVRLGYARHHHPDGHRRRVPDQRRGRHGCGHHHGQTRSSRRPAGRGTRSRDVTDDRLVLRLRLIPLVRHLKGGPGECSR
jgi:hypothetical protein